MALELDKKQAEKDAEFLRRLGMALAMDWVCQEGFSDKIKELCEQMNKANVQANGQPLGDDWKWALLVYPSLMPYIHNLVEMYYYDTEDMELEKSHAVIISDTFTRVLITGNFLNLTNEEITRANPNEYIKLAWACLEAEFEIDKERE